MDGRGLGDDLLSRCIHLRRGDACDLCWEMCRRRRLKLAVLADFVVLVIAWLVFGAGI